VLPSVDGYLDPLLGLATVQIGGKSIARQDLYMFIYPSRTLVNRTGQGATHLVGDRFRRNDENIAMKLCTTAAAHGHAWLHYLAQRSRCDL
jgi:hypothetical protein